MTSVASRPAPPADPPFPHVFPPVTVGTMKLRNRIMVPPHESAIGHLQRPDVHLPGDAFAPRRLVAATRHAYALAQLWQQETGTVLPGLIEILLRNERWCFCPLIRPR